MVRPGVAVFFPHADGRRGIGRVREQGGGERDHIGKAAQFPEHGGAATRAEVLRHAVAGVRRATPGAAFTFYPHLPARKPAVGAERRSGPLLASEAVAHGNARRFPAAMGLELTALASGGARAHLRTGREVVIRNTLSAPPPEWSPAGQTASGNIEKERRIARSSHRIAPAASFPNHPWPTWQRRSHARRGEVGSATQGGDWLPRSGLWAHDAGGVAEVGGEVGSGG